jgi:TRAP-type transport system periplasmic protein
VLSSSACKPFTSWAALGLSAGSRNLSRGEATMFEFKALIEGAAYPRGRVSQKKRPLWTAVTHKAHLLVRQAGQFFVVLFSLCVGPAAGSELRISHQFHESSDTRGRATRIFAEEVGLRSPELELHIYPQLSLGLTRDEQLEELQSGKLDLAVVPLVFGAKKIPEFSLALLPGLIPNLATARALKGTDVHAKLQEIAAANGLRIVTWWWMRGGFAMIGKEVTTPESVKGLKLQSCGLAQSVLAAAGAQLGDEPWEEIPMRMEMGALDGVAIPYEDFISMRLHKYARFATFGGPSILTCFSPMLMSKKTWDRLTPDQRRSIEEAAEVSDAYFEMSQLEAEKRAFAAFRRAGANTRSLTHDEYISWLQFAQRTAWTDYVKTSTASKNLINTTMRVILTELASKEELIDAIFPPDEKN